MCLCSVIAFLYKVFIVTDEWMDSKAQGIQRKQFMYILDVRKQTIKRTIYALLSAQGLITAPSG